MSGPRPIPDPESVIWSGVIAAVILAGLLGAGLARVLSRWLLP